MRKSTNQIGSSTLHREDFESYNELIRVCAEREYNSWADHKYRNDPNYRDSWSGNVSFNTAKDLLVEGWDEKEKEIRDKVSKVNIEGKSMASKTKLDVAGFAPCVPNYLMNLPLTMFNSYEDIKKSKVIDIVYDVTVASGVNSSEIIRKGVELLAKVQSLEMAGYRIKISVLSSYCHDDDRNWYMMTVPVKNEHQPLNICRVAFPLAHPAMLRIIGFDWYETLPGAVHNRGYGQSIHHWNWSQKDKLMEHFVKEHQVYINYYSDLNEIFNGIRKTNERNYRGE